MVSIDALETRPLDPSRLATQRGGREALYAIEWTPLPEAPKPEALRLAALGQGPPLEESGEPAIERYADLEALADAVAAGAEAPEQVLVAIEPEPGEGLPEAAQALAARALELLKAWLAAESLAEARLVLVTRAALAVADGERPDLRQAPLPGLVRSAHSEHPERFALIDGDGGELTEEVLSAALASGEPELALREGALLVPRLQHFRGGGALLPEEGETHWHLSVETPGTLESLRITSHPRAADPLAPGEVRVAVHAAGLNFRDVVITLGLLDGGPNTQIGYEGAGVVTEVGAEVSGLAPGDRVMGMIPEGFGPVAVTDQRVLAKIPEGWSFVEAASVPVVFLTAYYGLVDLAGLEAGESLLLHAAAGGVGMAALQLARHLGAEVFATAHPRKWETLAALGLDGDHIASSRTDEFEAEFLRRERGARRRRRARLARRAARRRLAAPAAPRRPLRRDGQDRHPRPGGGRRAASGGRLPGLRPPRDAAGADRRDARRDRRAVRARRLRAPADLHLGRAPRPGGLPRPPRGAPHRQARAPRAPAGATRTAPS